MKGFIYSVLILFLFAACDSNKVVDPAQYKVQANNPKLIHGAVERLTDVMVHDVVSPPVASRFYIYPIIAAYEALIPEYPGQLSLANQLNGLTTPPEPDTSKGICYPLASLHVYCRAAKAMVFLEDSIQVYADRVHAAKNGRFSGSL